ncbi:STAS domain-containing protein [Roseivirga sp. BDSF3-8]|uniref:STAS domain-containing protein n=1 Tax=Roseivirga sp. BDSF3-8 TaxID=3241598 RepID=UPI0035323122
MYDYLRSRKSEILKDWVDFQEKEKKIETDILSREEMEEESEAFLVRLLAYLQHEDKAELNSKPYGELKAFLMESARNRAQLGFSPKDTGRFVQSIKEVLLPYIKEACGEDVDRFNAGALVLTTVVDELVVQMFDYYIENREAIIMRQVKEIEEISTPVIQVWDGILALPIIGSMDSTRAQKTMESLLEAIVKLESDIAILDVSGVPTVDSLTAQHLIKTVTAAKLMGATCIISGIRPETAQTIVQLGIDLNEVMTKGSMATALKYGIELMSKSRNGKDTYLKN